MSWNRAPVVHIILSGNGKNLSCFGGGTDQQYFADTITTRHRVFVSKQRREVEKKVVVVVDKVWLKLRIKVITPVQSFQLHFLFFPLAFKNDARKIKIVPFHAMVSAHRNPRTPDTHDTWLSP